ncbi:hypothetical protein [Streptomyces sp. NPDC047315]|uniref:hypothetical protein n=1 Tax=Streptomyces sp. NPDC047315 TaxID=3155142 RepID=UPI0033D6647D
MVWSRVSLFLVEQYAELRYGPMLLVGVLLLTFGAKARSTNALCVGGLLVLLLLLR